MISEGEEAKAEQKKSSHITDCSRPEGMQGALKAGLSDMKELGSAKTTKITMADFMLRKLEDVVIRSYVIQEVLGKHLDIDEEDAVTLLTLLVEIESVQYSLLDGYEESGFLPPRKSHKKRRNRLSFFLEDNNFDLKAYAFLECEGGPRRRRRLFRRKNKNKEKTGWWGQGKRNRITSIRLGCWVRLPWNFHRPRVQEQLAKLERLETLHLHMCASVSLTQCLVDCSHVKHLHIETDCFNDWYLQNEVTVGFPTILREPPKKCKKNKNSDQHRQEFPIIHLENLHMYGPVMCDEGDLETFLFEILPCCPNLTKVEFERGNIISFQRIAQKIREKHMQTSSNLNDNDNHNTKGRLCTTFPSKIQTLVLGSMDPNNYKDNQTKLNHIQKDPLEMDAVKTILQYFPHLYCLSGAFGPVGSRAYNSSNHNNTPDNKNDHPYNWSEIDALAEHNFAGRALVEARHGQDNLYNDDSLAIPLSVWPKVVERAWARHPYISHDFQNGNDGIYYLLQNVPALLLEANTRRK